MTFTFDPPRLPLYIVIAAMAVVMAMVLFSRRPPARKLIAVVVAAVVLAVVASRIGTIGSSPLTVAAAGLAYGEENIPWSSVERAAYVADLSVSEYRPTRRMNGTALGGARFGRFELANGDRALLALQQSDSDVVVIATRDTTYLFAPDGVAGLAAAMAEHVPLAGWSTAR